MNAYQNKPQQLAADAAHFVKSEYGKYRMDILDSMIEGALSAASSPLQQFPDRYIARYSALKELKESILSDFESDTPPHQK